jgi:hypothetical protein
MSPAPFQPRPAVLSLTLEGVRVIKLRITNDLARALARQVNRARRQIGQGLPVSDMDLAEFVVAVLALELQTMEDTQ